MTGSELLEENNDVALLTGHFHFQVCLGEEGIVIRAVRSLAAKNLRPLPLSAQRCL